jgi:hypothetical protein
MKMARNSDFARRCEKLLASLFAALVIIAGLSGAARAAICSGINLPDTLDREEPLVLNGMGLRLATIFNFKVYVAGLYVPERQASAEEIIGVDQPRVLVMVFLRSVDQRTMQDAIYESIKSNWNPQMEPVRDMIANVPQIMPAVREGQTLIFDYAPEFGTAVMLDGETITNLEGDAVASAVFSLWLNNPPNEELKRGLLGGRCE